MGKPLKLLLIEDSEDDALLLTRHLRRHGYDLPGLTRIDTADDMRAALIAQDWDIVIADYTLPKFNGLAALEIYHAYELDIPFILVSGTIGESVAVTAMKAGAHDYLMKDNLARLVPAIERELAETEQRRRREQAEDQLHILSQAIEQSPSLVFITDAQRMIEYVNPKFSAVTGYTAAEVIGKSPPNLLATPLIPAETDEAIAGALNSGGEWRGELRNRRKDNSLYWAASSISPIRDDSGQITHFLFIEQDITARKEAEQALNDSEFRFRQLVERAADAIFVMDSDGIIITVNEQACYSLGYAREELHGTKIIDYDFRLDDMSEFWELSRRDIPLTINTRYIRRDKTTFPVEIRAALFEAQTEQYIIALVRDMTVHEDFQIALQAHSVELERLVEERTQQLQQRIEEMQAILLNSSDAIALVAMNGDITTYNPAFGALFGDRLTGESIEHLLSLIVAPEQMEVITTALVTTWEEGIPTRVEARILSQQGEEIDADIALTPVKDQAQTLTGVLLSMRDVTERREIERLKTQFIANAAHDLANPIANFKLHLYGLQRAASPDRVARHMSALQNQTRRLENLVDDLRTLSLIDRGAVQLSSQRLDLNQMIKDIIVAHEPQIQESDHHVVCELSSQPALILADYDKFERVVVNLFVNALNYTPSGGMITLSTRCENGHIIFRVADTGIGIAPDDLPHIFERFYRSDDVKASDVDGTGLGLAIVREIVEYHQGEIEVHSTLGAGSAFTIHLPQFEDTEGSA